VRPHVTALREQGISVVTLDRSQQAVEALARPETSVLIVDASCPDSSSLAREARLRPIAVPCLLLTDFSRPDKLAEFGEAFVWPSAPGHAAGLATYTAEVVSKASLRSSSRQLEAENSALRAGIAEAHHRIKNSLQNVISLINLQFRKAGQLGEEDVQKLSAHIHGLAVLHDLLVAQARAGQSMESVPVERIFERLGSILARGGNEDRIVMSETFESCRVAPRQAASLGIVFNEIVSNAIKHGSGRIEIQLENDGISGILVVRNEGSTFSEHFSVEKSSKAGLALIQLLSSADLGSEPQFRTVHGMAEVSIRFPLHASEQTQSGSAGQDSEVVQ
jgi:two-component sensor histidine kinase